jgi:ABC-type Fe3+-citrate transport system substrate-binding protein
MVELACCKNKTKKKKKKKKKLKEKKRKINNLHVEQKRKMQNVRLDNCRTTYMHIEFSYEARVLLPSVKL